MNSTYMAVQVGLCNYEIGSVSWRYPHAASKLHDVLNQGYQGLLCRLPLPGVASTIGMDSLIDIASLTSLA